MKERKAQAIQYKQGENAPKLVAKGIGETANILLDIAQAHGIPIVENTQLSDELSNLNLFESIPSQYWDAVAEILGYVYRLNESRKNDELH